MPFRTRSAKLMEQVSSGRKSHKHPIAFYLVRFLVRAPSSAGPPGRGSAQSAQGCAQNFYDVSLLHGSVPGLLELRAFPVAGDQMPAGIDNPGERGKPYGRADVGIDER